MTPLQAYLKDVMDADAKRTPGPWFHVAEKTNPYWPEFENEHWACPQPSLPGDFILKLDHVSENDRANCEFIALAANKLGTIAKLAEAFEAALEFYADMNNWLEIDGTDGCREQISGDSFKHGNGFSVGGKRAREALALRDKLIGGKR